MRYSIPIMTLLLLSIGWLAGCSDTAGTHLASTPQRNGKAVLTIKWPARSRLIPVAANCIVVKLADGAGFSVSQEADRPATGSFSTLTFGELPTETLTVTATAYPNTGASGTAQAIGQTTVTPVAGQTGTLSLTMNSTIDHLVIMPTPSTLLVGGTVTLTAAPVNAAGDLVLTAPGNISWSSSNTAAATVDPASGLVTGVNAGSTNITATESDSGKSTGLSLTVPPVTVSITPSAIFLYTRTSIDFVAKAVAANNGVTWAIQEGPEGGTITCAGHYTAPAGPGTYHVVATSIADMTKSATATITVNNIQIYVADYSNNRIVRIDDMAGADWTALGSYGSGANQFSGPMGIALDPDGKIYVADYTNNRIVRMDDMTGANWTTQGSYGSGIHQFEYPTGITFGPDGKIYVADYSNNRIVRMDDMTGANWTTLGGFHFPASIAFGPDRKIYVADSGNARVVRMDDISGANLATIGSQGNGAKQFNHPLGIAIGPDGKIYVADYSNSRIVRMDDMTGANWTTLGSNGSDTNQFIGPHIALGPDGNIYVAEWGNNRIVRFDDMTGSEWTTLGSQGNGVNQFYNPVAIAVR